MRLSLSGQTVDGMSRLLGLLGVTPMYISTNVLVCVVLIIVFLGATILQIKSFSVIRGDCGCVLR